MLNQRAGGHLTWANNNSQLSNGKEYNPAQIEDITYRVLSLYARWGGGVLSSLVEAMLSVFTSEMKYYLIDRVRKEKKERVTPLKNKSKADLQDCNLRILKIF